MSVERISDRAGIGSWVGKRLWHVQSWVRKSSEVLNRRFLGREAGNEDRYIGGQADCWNSVFKGQKYQGKAFGLRNAGSQ